MAKSKIEYLHDAILKEIRVGWEAGSVSIQFQLNEVYSKGGSLFVVLVSNLMNLQLPRMHPWGESIYVNEVLYDESEKQIEIEMQSGDVIKISGTKLIFADQQEL